MEKTEIELDMLRILAIFGDKGRKFTVCGCGKKIGDHFIAMSPPFQSKLAIVVCSVIKAQRLERAAEKVRGNGYILGILG